MKPRVFRQGNGFWAVKYRCPLTGGEFHYTAFTWGRAFDWAYARATHHKEER